MRPSYFLRFKKLKFKKIGIDWGKILVNKKKRKKKMKEEKNREHTKLVAISIYPLPSCNKKWKPFFLYFTGIIQTWQVFVLLTRISQISAQITQIFDKKANQIDCWNLKLIELLQALKI